MLVLQGGMTHKWVSRVCPRSSPRATDRFSTRHRPARYLNSRRARTALVDERWPGALAKRIEDHNALHVSAVRHILGVKLPAPKRARRGDDRTVPIRETVRRFDV